MVDKTAAGRKYHEEELKSKHFASLSDKDFQKLIKEREAQNTRRATDVAISRVERKTIVTQTYF